MDWHPPFASTDLAAGSRAIVTTAGTQTLLWMGAASSRQIAVYDGRALIAKIMTGYSKGDCIRLVLRADLTNSLMHLSYRNMSNGDSFTHVAAVAYDGAFSDTGVYKYFLAVGGNNSIIRNDLGYNKLMEKTDLEALYG